MESACELHNMVSDAPDDFDRKTAEPIHKVILHYQSIICVHTVTPFHVPIFFGLPR